VAVDAPASVALAAARDVTPREAPLLAFLFRLRRLPARPRVPIFEQLLESGFTEIRSEEAEVVARATGQPWRLRGRDDSGSFVAMTLRIRAGEGRLWTETAVEPSDAEAARRFRRYWLVIKPFSGVVRRSWLAAAKRRAENPQRRLS
jgi:hypothetical protein